MPTILRHAIAMPSRCPLFIVPFMLAMLAIAGCSSGPARVEQAAINASYAAKQAIQQYDTNSDGKVAGDELEHAPGLKAALATTDKNHDGAITADELTARIEEWQATRVGLTTFGFAATLDGRPLEGAIVTFEPEAFLGDEIQPAVATTDMLGTGGPSIAKENRPTPTTPPGVSLGIYKVKFSKIVDGQETIPPIYNENTIFGIEVAPDVSDILNRRIRYVLKTK